MKFRQVITHIFTNVTISSLVLGLACLNGCGKPTSRTASFGSGVEVIAYGVYSAQNQDNNGFSTKLSLNQNGTFSRKKFQGPCLLSEFKGGWSSKDESLEFRTTDIRKRVDCNAEDWEVEKVGLTTTRILRNVTTKSFDLLDEEEDVSALWVRFVRQ